MSGRVCVLWLVCAAAAAPAAWAQGTRPRAGQRAEQRREEMQLRREEAFKIVDAYLVANLQESLALSEEQFAKVLPVVRRLQAERREHFLSRGRLLRELRRLMHRGGASEAEVVAKLAELKAIEEEGPARVRREMAALDAVLTPLQQAKYRLLEGDVEQRMRALARRHAPATQRLPPE